MTIDSEIEHAVARIRLMEEYFDRITEAAKGDLHEFEYNAELVRMVHILAEYYDGGMWLADYELDEKGKLPPVSELKRGVLSQDGIYDLLCGVLSEIRI